MDKLTVSLRKKPPLSVSVNARTIPPVTEELRITPNEIEQVFMVEGNVTGYNPVVVEAMPKQIKIHYTQFGVAYPENVEIPDGVEQIGSSVTSYRYATELLSVVAPTSVTTLQAGVFANCSKLEICDLEKTNITAIANTTFSNCESLHTIMLPATVLTTVSGANSQSAFYGCSSIKTVILGSGWLATVRFSYSTAFDADDIVNMFNALGVVSEGEERTLYLGAKNLSKLTDTQKQIATDKGWTLA